MPLLELEQVVDYQGLSNWHLLSIHGKMETSMETRSYRKYYQQRHRTLGCKITHMIGVPLIVCSLVLVFFNWKLALVLFIAGWALQFAGHLFFEQNNPALLARPGHAFTYFVAIIFVAEQWRRLLTGRPLTDKQKEQ